MHPTQRSNRNPGLDVSLELAGKSWKIALTDGRRANAALGKVDAGDLGARLQELAECLQQFKAKWDLPRHCRVALIYEAGQDGFWIARALQAMGVEVFVVDAASIPVARHICIIIIVVKTPLKY